MMPFLLSSGSPTSSNRSDNSYICSIVGVSVGVATGTDAPVPPPIPYIGKLSSASSSS